jgi:hypothetical protein
MPTTAETTAAEATTATDGAAGTTPAITIVEPVEGASIATNSVTIQVDVSGFALVQPPEETGITGTTTTTAGAAETTTGAEPFSTTEAGAEGGTVGPTVSPAETTMGTSETGAMSGHIHYFMDGIPPTTPGVPAVNGTLMADANTTATAATTTTAAGIGETTTTAADAAMTTAADAGATTTTAGGATTGAVTVTSANTVYTFENVVPGEHVFAVELVNSDHTPLSPPVTAIVNVTVSEMGLEAGATTTTAATMTTEAGAVMTTVGTVAIP